MPTNNQPGLAWCSKSRTNAPRIKPWAWSNGKVEIGSKWEDPSLLNPILRTLPRGSELWLPPTPPNPLAELGDLFVGVICGLIFILLLAQGAGWIPS